MAAVVSLLLVVTLSILVTRIAAVALSHTGLSRQAARFQARSAFTGSGFTTSESERVVNHPVRRRIILLLMLLGNAGIVTAVSSLILTFMREGDSEVSPEIKIIMLVVGLVALWALAISKAADRVLSRVIERALRRYTSLDVHDYGGLLHLAGEYRIVELPVRKGGWLDDRKLADVRLTEEGILVLGIEKPGGEWLGTPGGGTTLRAGDKLVIYGRTETIRNLDTRRRDSGGERAHQESVRQQERVAEEERKACGD